MMQVHRFTFNPIQENTYVVFDDSKQCVLIDCGNFYPKEDKELADFIYQHELTPVRILNTHLHLDHSFGNAFVFSKYSIKPEANQADEFLIEKMPQYVAAFSLDHCPNVQPLGAYIKNGDYIKFGNDIKLQVIETPGHTPGGVCFYEEKEKTLFSGDSLFFGSIGRTDLPKGNQENLVHSLQNNILTLPEDVIVRPGHGKTTSIGYEKQYNNYI